MREIKTMNNCRGETVRAHSGVLLILISRVASQMNTKITWEGMNSLLLQSIYYSIYMYIIMQCNYLSIPWIQYMY